MLHLAAKESVLINSTGDNMRALFTNASGQGEPNTPCTVIADVFSKKDLRANDMPKEDLPFMRIKFEDGSTLCALPEEINEAAWSAEMKLAVACPELFAA